MLEYSSILRLLEAERDRYVLEAAELERRLQHVRNQMTSLEVLISGYAKEEQMYPSQRRFFESSGQALLEDSPTDEADGEELGTTGELDMLSPEKEDTRLDTAQQSSVEVNQSAVAQETAAKAIASPPTPNPDPQSPIPLVETVAPEVEPDISDIPKLNAPRKPGTLAMLGEFQEYSVQNAILVLMRRRPELHFQIDAIVRDLYGDELTPEQFKNAKMNVGKALSTGVNMGLWHRVLRASGVYTLHYEKGVTAKPSRRS
jgi:hypothetical protein